MSHKILCHESMTICNYNISRWKWKYQFPVAIKYKFYPLGWAKNRWNNSKMVICIHAFQFLLLLLLRVNPKRNPLQHLKHCPLPSFLLSYKPSFSLSSSLSFSIKSNLIDRRKLINGEKEGIIGGEHIVRMGKKAIDEGQNLLSCNLYSFFAAGSETCG